MTTAKEPRPPSLQNGRATCPKCGRKGLGYAPHPHALGWKDHKRARCRYCRMTFAVRKSGSGHTVSR